MSMSTIDLKQYACVGIITSAHGIQGQVKIKTFTVECESISAYGDLYDKNGTVVLIESKRVISNNSLIATIKGIKDRNAAEALRNTKLYVLKSAFPELEEEEFYYEDLMGSDLYVYPKNADSMPIGKVLQVYNFGAGDILELQLVRNGKPVGATIPFTQEAVPNLNVSEKFIEINPDFVLEAIKSSRQD